MSPLLLMIVVLLLPLAALLVQRLGRGELRALQAFAREHQLHFTIDDRFQIASRVAELLPSPGAADVRVYHLVYGRDGSRYHFIFTVEWTEGSVRSKRRSRRVASFSEEKDRSGQSSAMQLQLASAEHPRIDQYARLFSSCCQSMQTSTEAKTP